VGGRIAQVGNRLVDSAALKLADDFFAAFEKTIAPPPVAAVPDHSSSGGLTPLQVVLIAAILVCLVAAVGYTMR
jgi:hypothetical protein